MWNDFVLFFNSGWGVLIVFLVIIGIIYGVAWLAAREELKDRNEKIR